MSKKFTIIVWNGVFLVPAFFFFFLSFLWFYGKVSQEMKPIVRKEELARPAFITYYDKLDREKLALVQPWSLAVLAICLLDISFELAVYVLLGRRLEKKTRGKKKKFPFFYSCFFQAMLRLDFKRFFTLRLLVMASAHPSSISSSFV